MKRAYSTKPGSRGCRPSQPSKSLPCERRAALPSARNPPRPLPSSNSFPRHAADDRQHLRTRACARQSPYLRHKAAPRPFRHSKRSLLPFSPRTRTIPPRCPFSPCMRRTPSVSEKVRVKNCSRTPADVPVISPAARHPGLCSRRAFGTATRRTKFDAGFRMSDSAPWGLRRTSKHDRRLGPHSRKARENRRVA